MICKFAGGHLFEMLPLLLLLLSLPQDLKRSAIVELLDPCLLLPAASLQHLS
jgi:hypothetical protein